MDNTIVCKKFIIGGVKDPIHMYGSFSRMNIFIPEPYNLCVSYLITDSAREETHFRVDKMTEIPTTYTVGFMPTKNQVTTEDAIITKLMADECMELYKNIQNVAKKSTELYEEFKKDEIII